MALGAWMACCLTANGQGMHWLENQGQWDVPATMRTEWAGGVTWLERDGMNVWVAGEGYEELWAHGFGDGVAPSGSLTSHAWRTTWEGAHPDPVREVLTEASHRVNIYKGSDPSTWAEGLVPATRFKVLDVYPGIDLRVGPRSPGDRDAMPGPGWKEDWLVQPGADPGAIAIRHEGVTLEPQNDGSVRVALGATAEARLGVPFAYQTLDGKMVPVDVAYALEGSTVRFDVGAYDPSAPLILDPDIVFATFIGASQPNWGFTAAYDDEARALGGTALWDGSLGTYPTTAGAIETEMTVASGPFDCGFSVFSADGSQLLYSTVFGGDELDVPSSIVSDSQGAIYVLGTTGSVDFPVTAGAFEESFCNNTNVNLDACCFYPGGGGLPQGSSLFVMKFTEVDAGCTLDRSTFVGGCNGPSGVNQGEFLAYNYGDVFRGEINVDDLDRPWVASVTSANDFPMVNAPYPAYGGGLTDAVLFRLSSDLSTMEWSTYLGGASDDAAYGVQFTPGDEAVVCGGTSSADFPVQANADDFTFGGQCDGFVLKFPFGDGAPNGGTFFGTGSYDQAYFVQVDPLGRVYLFGQSTGNKPISAGTYNASPQAGQFVVCYEPGLDQTAWHTRVGDPGNVGSVDISPTAFLVSDCGEIYLSGWGGSTNNSQSPYIFSSGINGMPTTNDAFQLTTNDGDFWLGVLSPGAVDLNYATYFGGGTSNEHVDGGTSRFDKDGTVYQAMCAGCGGNSDLPTTPGVWSDTNDSFNCNLGLFKFELGQLVVGIDLENPDQLCDGQTITFLNTSTPGFDYLWTFDDNTTSSEYQPEHVFPQPGIYNVVLTIVDPSGCLAPLTADIEVNIQALPDPTISPVGPICVGESIELVATGSEDLMWDPNPLLGDLTDPFQTVTPPAGISVFSVSEENLCGEGEASIEVVVQEVEAEVTPSVIAVCLGDGVELEATGAANAQWEPATGLDNPGSTTVLASPTESTTYTVTLTNAIGCTDDVEVDVNVVPGPPGGEVYPALEICQGYGIQLAGAEGDDWLWSPAESLNDGGVQYPYASPAQTTTYSVAIQNICGVGIDEVTVLVNVPQAFASEDGGVCRGTPFDVSAYGLDPDASFVWTPSEFVTSPSSPVTTVTPPDTQTFTVFVTDSDGCVASDQVTVFVTQPPPISAGGDRDVEWLDEVQLSGYTSGLDWYWTPAEDLSCDTCLNPTVVVDEPGWYVLHAVDSTGCGGADSVFIDIFYPVYIPSSFTPNNDGINDAFEVVGQSLRGFWMRIFNRWGEEIFYTQDPGEPWTGNVRGGRHAAPDGVYFYQVRYEEAEGPLLLEGTVVLLR